MSTQSRSFGVPRFPTVLEDFPKIFFKIFLWAIFKTGNGEPGDRGTVGPRNRGTGEQGNRATREQGNRGTGEPRNRGTVEEGNRGSALFILNYIVQCENPTSLPILGQWKF